MEYTNYKGFNISKIGMNCYSLIDANGKINIPDFKDRLNHSLKSGVNYFHSSNIYNGTHEILGETIKPYRYNVYVSNKLTITNNIGSKINKAYLKTYCEKTLDKLKTDYIDIFNLNIYNVQVPIDETICTLEELIKEGKIRKYGVINLPSKEPDKYFKRKSIFSLSTSLNALPYNSLDKTLSLCQKHNVGVFISIDDIIDTNIKDLERYYKKTSNQIAISWLLSRPKIVCVLINPLTKQLIDESMEGMSLMLCKEHLEDIKILWK